MKTVSLLLMLIISNLIHAQQAGTPVSFVQSGHYLPGIAGVRDYANPGQDGLFLIDYNVFLNADTYYDRNGNKVNSIQGPLGNTIPLNIDISGYINSLMLVYATPKLPFLGNAQYLFIASPNYTTANVRVGLGELINNQPIEGGASGFGDLVVSPLMLSWGFEKFDITGAYIFYAPTGRYDTGASDNIGLGYWSHIVQLASYYYPKADKSTALLLMPSYEFQGKIKDVDVKPGSRFTLEYGVSQYLSERFEVFLQGGHSWQVGEDSGGDVYWDKSVKDRMSVFGFGAGYWLVPETFYANVKYTSSYGLRQQFKSNLFQIELLFVPNFLKSKPALEE